MEFLHDLPERVSIHEVAARDGLQNEAVTVATTQKARLVNALVDSGLKRIEVTSFVSPKWVPQLADGEQLIGLVERPDGVTFSALCPNLRGLDRALAAGVDEIGLFVSASDTHNRRNINRSVPEAMNIYARVARRALDQGLAVRAYVSTVWGCPYEGDTDPGRAAELGREFLDWGCYQVSLGDTIGVGTPLQTKRILDTVFERVAPSQLALHMHDTRGTALANVLVGLEMGIVTFDASVGGLGGCPYAPGAAGNLATEDLVYALHGMGIDTGVDLDALIEAGRVAEAVVGRELPGKVHQAGRRALRV